MLYRASLKWPLVEIHSLLLASGSRGANRPTHGEELPSKSCRTRRKKGDLPPAALLFECAGYDSTTNEVMDRVLERMCILGQDSGISEKSSGCTLSPKQLRTHPN